MGNASVTTRIRRVSSTAARSVDTTGGTEAVPRRSTTKASTLMTTNTITPSQVATQAATTIAAK